MQGRIGSGWELREAVAGGPLGMEYPHLLLAPAWPSLTSVLLRGGGPEPLAATSQLLADGLPKPSGVTLQRLTGSSLPRPSPDVDCELLQGRDHTRRCCFSLGVDCL